MTMPEQVLPESTLPINKQAAMVLEWGFRLSAALLAIGIVTTLIRGEDIPTSATRLVDLIPDLLSGDGGAIVTTAIVSMIATPVVATLVVAAGFLAANDRRYARISFAVLAVLLVSIAAALIRQ